MNDPYDPPHTVSANRGGGFDPMTAHVLNLREAAQLRESAERLLKESSAMFAEAQQRTRGRSFSIVRAVDCARFNRRLDGIEGEWSQECARQMNLAPDPSKPFIPWSAFGRRTLQAGTAAAGGNLVGAPAWRPVDVLAPFSTLIRLGAQVFDGVVGNPLIPRVTTSGDAAWLAETGTATSSDPVLGQIAATPKRIAGYREYTKQMLNQGPAIEDMLKNDLSGILGREIDKLMLSGTGSTEMLGILNTVGVTLTTGTAFDHAVVQPAAFHVSTGIT